MKEKKPKVGRPLKFGEETITIRRRVTKPMIKPIDDLIETFVKNKND